jgi:hypothetical protein
MRVLDAFRHGVPESGVQRKPNLVGKRLGNGVVARAIGEVLADGQPKKLVEIRRAVERQVGQAVSIESVSWCLRMGSCKEPPVFVRPGRGFYQLVSQA